jgi:ribose-phosphate pyrophosphokinase
MMHFLAESTQHLRGLLIKREASIGSYRRAEYADGEWGYQLTEDVKRQDVMVVASVLPDPRSLFDMLSLFRLLRDNKARSVSLTIPYLGYARQDHAEMGETELGIMVSELIRNLNPAKVNVLAPHSPKIVEHLGPNTNPFTVTELFAKAYVDEGTVIDAVVAPDEGARERCEAFAGAFDPAPEVVHIDKMRPEPNVAIAQELHGDVEEKNVVIFDDIIDTGGTVREAVNTVLDAGAQSVRVAATHGVLSSGARSMLKHLPVDDVKVTNSLEQERVKHIQTLDVTPTILELTE